MPVVTIVILAFLLIVGIITPRRAAVRVGMLGLSLLFIPILAGIAKSFWGTANLATKFLLLFIVIPVGFFSLVRVCFGADIYHHLVGSLLHDFVRGLFRLPAAACRRLFRTNNATRHRQEN